MKMVLASHEDQKYPRYPLVLKLNVTFAQPLRFVIMFLLGILAYQGRVLEVIKLVFILNLKIRRNDWLLASKYSAMIGCLRAMNSSFITSRPGFSLGPRSQRSITRILQ